MIGKKRRGEGMEGDGRWEQRRGRKMVQKRRV